MGPYYLKAMTGEVLVDLGYRGRDQENPERNIVHRGKPRRLTQNQRRWLKRRQSIEPIIGHLKSDYGGLRIGAMPP